MVYKLTVNNVMNFNNADLKLKLPFKFLWILHAKLVDMFTLKESLGN